MTALRIPSRTTFQEAWEMGDCAGAVLQRVDRVSFMVHAGPHRVRLVIVSFVGKHHDVDRHLQRCHAHFALADTQAGEEPLRPSARAVARIHPFRRREKPGAFLVDINVGKLAEAELRRHVRPVVEPHFQHELIEVDVAGMLDCVHHVHRPVHVKVMEDLVPEAEGAAAGDAPGRGRDMIFQRGKREDHLERGSRGKRESVARL